MTVKNVLAVVFGWLRDEKRYFEEEGHDIAQRNILHLSALSWIAVITIIVCSALTGMLVEDWDITVYHVGAVLFFAAFGLIMAMVKQNKVMAAEHSDVLCIMFVLGMLASAIAICSFPYPDLDQVFVSLVFTIIPVILIMRARTSLALIFGGELVFLILSCICKDDAVFKRDVFSSLTGCILAVVVCLSVLSLRITNYRNRTMYKNMNIVDPLCHVLNRRAFDIYSRVFTAISKRSIAVLLFDIDNFNIINSTAGFKKGDELLVLLSGIMEEKKDDKAYVGRIGGDKFCMVMEFDCSPENIKSAARKIQKEFKNRSADIAGSVCYCSSGISIHLKDEERRDYAELMHEAEEMLYLSKSVGGKCCNVYSDSMKA